MKHLFYDEKGHNDCTGVWILNMERIGVIANLNRITQKVIVNVKNSTVRQ